MQYGEYAYAAVVIAALIYVLLRIRKGGASTQAGSTRDAMEISQASMELPTVSRAKGGDDLPDPAPWWDQEDFPYSAPWWLRYPASIAVFAGSYWAFFEWDKKAGWILGALLTIIGLGLVRELFVGALIAVFAGLVLWAFGAAVAALPVSVAIIIGAMIIAQSVSR